jgi:hyperosmotically inducible protein
MTGEYMISKNVAIGVVTAVVLCTAAYAQTPAVSSMSNDSNANSAALDQGQSTKKAERAANRAFAKRIRQTLYKTKGLEDSDIVVFAKAKTGQVTLSGFILTEDQDHIATAAVGKVQGVSSVTSKLTLQEQGG